VCYELGGRAQVPPPGAAGRHRGGSCNGQERKYSPLDLASNSSLDSLSLYFHDTNIHTLTLTPVHAPPHESSPVHCNLTSPRSESRKPPQEIHVPDQKSRGLFDQCPLEGLRVLHRHTPVVAEQYQHCIPASYKKQRQHTHARAQRIQEKHLQLKRKSTRHNTTQHIHSPWAPHSLAPWPRSSAARKCAC